jgi:hypothetical protein
MTAPPPRAVVGLVRNLSAVLFLFSGSSFSSGSSSPPAQPFPAPHLPAPPLFPSP